MKTTMNKVMIALQAPDRYGGLLDIGIMAQITLQVLMNIAVVTNTMPNTGISLPFFSSGGTSMLMLMGEMGVMLSINRAGNVFAEDQRARQEEDARQAEPPPRENSDPLNGLNFDF